MDNVESVVRCVPSPDAEIHATRRPFVFLGWLLADLSHVSDGDAATGQVRPTNSSATSNKFAGTWANAVSTTKRVGVASAVVTVGFAHNSFDAFATWCDGASPLLAPSGSGQPQRAQQKN